MNTGFLGRDGFIWAIGVVEDRHDPDKMGRVKTRWLGYHTAEQSKISTEQLPWSQVMQPVGGHAMSGVGESHPGIEEGTWVIGFARDPESLQDWIIMGTLPGMNTQPSKHSAGPVEDGLPHGGWGRSSENGKFGFFDPTGTTASDKELSDIPFPPSALTWRKETETTITPNVDVIETANNQYWGPGPFDKMKMYGDEILYGTSPSYQATRDAELDLPKGTAKTVPILTHTDALFETYGTTRRLVGPPTDSTRFWTNIDKSENATNINLGHVISTGFYHHPENQDITQPSYPVISEVAKKHRNPYPRMAMCQKKNIEKLYGKTMLDKIEKLFDDGVYGNVGTKKWKDVPDTHRIAIPLSDYNRLARGGMKITDITFSPNVKVTVDSLTEVIQENDIIMLSGIHGMHELNGRRFKVKKLLGKVITIGSADGTPISGPGDTDVEKYSKNNTISPMADQPQNEWEYGDDFKFSQYGGGGVVLTDGHFMIRRRAETREKWINIGHGMFPETPKAPFANDDRTQEFMTHYWSEPTSAYAAQYPYNKVYESESGHIMEYDDTPGAERINQTHRSGTYYEIDDSGNKTTKVTGDNHNLTIHDDYLYVKGKIFWTGDDEVMIRANDQMTVGAKWNIRLVSDHNIDIHAKGDLNLRGHNVNIEAKENSINMLAGQVKVKAIGYSADTEVGSGYQGKGGQDQNFGGLIHLESAERGTAGGRIVLKVPQGDPFAGLEGGADFAGNLELPGGAIVHEGGTTVDITDSPKSRNTLQARVNFAFKAADSVTSSAAGSYSNAEGDIGTWGSLSDATHVGNQEMTGPSVNPINNDDEKLFKPQTNPFAGSTAPAINVNAEKVRNLHDTEVK